MTKQEMINLLIEGSGRKFTDKQIKRMLKHNKEDIQKHYDFVVNRGLSSLNYIFACRLLAK